MKKVKLLIDGHVHIYDCYDIKKFLEAAIINLERDVGTYNSSNGEVEKILLLTEARGSHFFNTIKKNNGLLRNSGFSALETKETASLLLDKDNNPAIYLIQGRQIVTRENLEVLHLATTEIIEDGLPIDTLLNKIIARKEMAALAWGFGKWWFNRGKIISNIIDTFESPYLFLCDNSARFNLLPTPRQFKQGKHKNIPILCGSDPLPFEGEEDQVGRFGFSLTGSFDPSFPIKSLQNILTSSNLKLECFGSRENIVKFSKRQRKVYLKKYLNF